MRKRSPCWSFILALIAALLAAGSPAAQEIANDMLVFRDDSRPSGSRTPPQTLTHSSKYGFSDTIISAEGGFPFPVAEPLPLQWIKVVAKPDSCSDEKVLCSAVSRATVKCQVWHAGGWSHAVETTPYTVPWRAFDVTYIEPGHALACYRAYVPSIQSPTNPQLPLAIRDGPNCTLWNGSTWHAGPIPLNSGKSIPSSLRLSTNSDGSNAALLVRDTQHRLTAQILDEGQWVDEIVLTRHIDQQGCRGDCNSALLPYGGAWESSGDEFVTVWLNVESRAIETRRYDRLTRSWSSIETLLPLPSGNTAEVEVEADPASNTIMVAVADGSDELRSVVWDGDGWGESHVIVADLNPGLVEDVTNINRIFDLAYQSDGGKALVVYGKSKQNLRYKVYTSAWGSEQPLPANVAGTNRWQLAADPKSRQMMATIVGSFPTADDGVVVETLGWNGREWESSWTPHTHETSAVYQNAYFAFGGRHHDPLVIHNGARINRPRSAGDSHRIRIVAEFRTPRWLDLGADGLAVSLSRRLCERPLFSQFIPGGDLTATSAGHFKYRGPHGATGIARLSIKGRDKRGIHVYKLHLNAEVPLALDRSDDRFIFDVQVGDVVFRSDESWFPGRSGWRFSAR